MSIEERKKNGSSEEKYGLAVLGYLMRHLSFVAQFQKTNRVPITTKTEFSSLADDLVTRHSNSEACRSLIAYVTTLCLQMTESNLATVFAPNLVHSVMEHRRPESVISEIEFNNIIVERLIENAGSIFP